MNPSPQPEVPDRLLRTMGMPRWIVLFGGLLLTACGMSSSPPKPPRLVVLYAPCTVNRLFLAPYDDAVPSTPNLARFAEEGVVFDAHYTEAGQSGIAYAALFTGSQADHHAIYRHPQHLRDEVQTVFEAFRDLGWDTFYWGEHFAARSGLGYAQGVDRAKVVRRRLDSDAPRFRAILDHLRRDPEYRAFVVTSFTVTHAPYRSEPLAEYRRRYPEAAAALTDDDISRFVAILWTNALSLSYDFAGTVRRLRLEPDDVERLVAVVTLLYRANVMALDDLFGGVVSAIDAAGLRDESLIVFTADHGEVLWSEHALFPFAHSMQLANDVLQIPWIVRGAGLRPGSYAGVTRSIDVLPTLVGLVGGHETAPAVQGVDLAPALRGETPPPTLTAYAHTTVLVRSLFEQMNDPEHRAAYGRVPELFPTEDVHWIWTALREGDLLFKLERRAPDAWRTSAFDVVADPAETRDRFDAGDPSHRAAAERLAAYKRRLVDAYPERERLLPGPEEREGLRSLGYIE